MEYTTRDEIRLEVGRVERRLLDAVHIPEPVPPSRVVETWGGVEEEIPDYKDKTYRRRLHDWHAKVWRARLHTISGALTFELNAEQRAELEAIRAIGLGDGTDTDYLRFMLSEYDQSMLVEIILYQSTVTPRGINEAVNRLDYTWRDKPVLVWAASYTPGRRGELGVDMRAAFRSGLTWEHFCAMPGPEQSQHVAFWMLEDKLMWLVNSGN